MLKQIEKFMQNIENRIKLIPKLFINYEETYL